MSKVLMKVDNELFTGSALVDTGEEPALTWKGARISGLTWGRITGFLAAVYEKHKSEAQLRLLYNTKHRKWAVFVHGQEVSGASAKEQPGATSDPEYKTLHDAGFEQFGTVHSHANMGASQSGIDHADEANSPGLHVTIGKLGSDMFDFHGRLVYKGQQYEISLSDWVAWKECLPEGTDLSYITQIPSSIRDSYTTALMRYAMSHTGEFPKQWVDKVTPRVSVVFNHGGFGHNSIRPTKQNTISWVTAAQADTYFGGDDKMIRCLMARYGDSAIAGVPDDDIQETLGLLWERAKDPVFFDDMWNHFAGGYTSPSILQEDRELITRVTKTFDESILLDILQDIADAVDSPDYFRESMGGA